MTTQEFVGRRAELATFASLLESSSTHRVLALNGFGGVGKSTLVEQFCEIARRNSHPVALVNSRRLVDPEIDMEYPAAVEAVIVIERAFRNNGMKLPELAKKLNRYRKLHASLTRKFPGAEGAAVQAILKIGVSAIRAGATVFPLSAPLNAVLTPELATQVGAAISSYRRAADRQLLSRPIEELTACLVRELNGIAAREEKRVVIVFDEFERLPIRVEYWLQAFSRGEYGKVDDRVLLVLSGRDALSQDWTSRGLSGGPSELVQIRLEQFSADEVVEYLMHRGATADVSAAREIASGLGHIYRLPLVLRLLVGDPELLTLHRGGQSHLGPFADALVGRLLDARETSNERRDLALTMSVARRFDLSVVGALMEGLSPEAMRDGMNWLTRQNFVNVHAPAYTYYDLVRTVFLEHLRNTDPDLVDRMHRRIRAHFERLLDANDRNGRSRAMSVEVAYHALAASGVEPLTDALRLLFRYLPTAYEYGIEWSRAITQVLDERSDLSANERGQLERLAKVLEESWLLSVPAARPGAEAAADPAMNILFSSSFEDALPAVDDSNAELWLSYLESRLRIVAGGREDLATAFHELRRIWQSRAEVDGLLAFRVATDLADIHTRLGELGDALGYSQAAVEIAQAERAPIWHAFALYQLGNNQKRQGAYQAALQSLSTAIGLVHAKTGRSVRYYRGRFVLDRAITLTYMNEARAAAEEFEAARAAFAGTSQLSYAELSHRLGWLKRTRGDLAGALADHELAIHAFEALASGLHVPDGKTSAVSFSLGKALHSEGNVYADMARHEDALRTYDRAISLFREQGGRRHEAIVLKDRAWSRVVLDGYDGGEQDLLAAISQLGSHARQTERPAVNSATHLAEAWLMLARIRLCAGALDASEEALATALGVIGAEPNPPLLSAAQLQIGLGRAMAGDTVTALAIATVVADRAVADGEPQWHLAARAHLVEAVAYAAVGRAVERDHALARAHECAARWNEFEPQVLTDLWTRLSRIASEMATTNLTSAASPKSDVGDQEEIIDIYDERGRSQGQATSRMAHATGLWHRSFHCWIVARKADGDHRILLQRRGPFAKSFPNRYDISVAGHYKAGEGIEGGIRECREELGLEVSPDELVRIATRVIDENLYNGTINREFQDIYLLERGQPVESYALAYPELSAVVECSLRGLVGVVSGTVASAPCRGRRFDPDAISLVPFDDAITLADLIAEAKAYHQTVLPLIARLMDDGVPVPDADTGEPTKVGVRIADGSLWTELL